MLVDVPVSDVAIALLRQGSIAHVVLEGERKTRTGTVILTRGSAGTLGSHDLAALAKGRRAGIGQALVKLIPSPDDPDAIDVPAYTDFKLHDITDPGGRPRCAIAEHQIVALGDVNRGGKQLDGDKATHQDQRDAAEQRVR